jgi:hypothetical protein
MARIPAPKEVSRYTVQGEHQCEPLNCIRIVLFSSFRAGALRAVPKLGRGMLAN